LVCSGVALWHRSRNSIAAPDGVCEPVILEVGELKDTKSLELRATANNTFNIVQYAGVNTQIVSGTLVMWMPFSRCGRSRFWPGFGSEIQ
jgi:hypothetical protein